MGPQAVAWLGRFFHLRGGDRLRTSEEGFALD
jgi:hypothetical protein